MGGSRKRNELKRTNGAAKVDVRAGSHAAGLSPLSV